MTAEAVCNCPRGGIKRLCKLRCKQGPEVGYRPTRTGAMRIEDVNGRTRPADPRTHEGY